MGIRLLQLADLHLGAHGAWMAERDEARAEFRRKEHLAAFSRAVDFALDKANAIDVVVICGDLYESHRPSQAIITLVDSACARLSESDIPVVILPGLHDGIAYPDCVFNTMQFHFAHVLAGPHFTTPLTLTIKDTPVHFYGVPPRQGLETIETFRRTADPGIHIALLHGSLTGSPDFEQGAATLTFTPEQVAASEVHYAALGHYHNYQVYTYGGVIMAYAGSLEATSFADTEPRAYLIVEFLPRESDVDLTLTQVPYDLARPVIDRTIDLSQHPETSTESVAALIRQHANEKALARFTLTGPVGFVVDADAVRQAIREAFFHVEVDDATSLSSSKLVGSLSTETTVRGLFAKQILQRAEGPDADRRTLEVALKAGLRRFLEEEIL